MTGFSWEPFRAVLLDLDGVITPTTEFHERAWKLVFDEFLAEFLGSGAEPFAHADYLDHVDGRRRFDGVRSFLASRGLALPEGSPVDSPGFDSVCALGNAKNERFRALIGEERIRPYPDALSLLDFLDRHGLSTAVVTSSATAWDVLDAAGLGRRFEVVVDGLVARTERLRGKPAPDLLVHAAAELGAPPGSVVVIDDSVAGVAAGVEGRFGKVVGVTSEGPAPQLVEAGADLVVSDLGELVPA